VEIINLHRCLGRRDHNTRGERKADGNVEKKSSSIRGWGRTKGGPLSFPKDKKEERWGSPPGKV